MKEYHKYVGKDQEIYVKDLISGPSSTGRHTLWGTKPKGQSSYL